MLSLLWRPCSVRGVGVGAEEGEGREGSEERRAQDAGEGQQREGGCCWEGSLEGVGRRSRAAAVDRAILSESLSSAHCLLLFLYHCLLTSCVKSAFQLVEGNLMAEGKD